MTNNSNKIDSIISFAKKYPFWLWFIASILACIIFHEYGFLISFIAIFFAYNVYSKNLEEENRKKLIIEANKYIDIIKNSKSIPIIQPQGSMFLDKDENLFLTENSILEETRSVRHGSGGFGSVRIAKGVRIGGYSGASSSSLEWSNLDNGTLFLTSKKILFTGNKENRTIQLDKVVAIVAHINSIEVKIDGRSKAIQFPVNNPYIWSTVINIIKSVDNPLKLGDLKINIQLK